MVRHDSIHTVTVRAREEWRAWLAVHAATAIAVRVECTLGVHAEVRDEALCYGWGERSGCFRPIGPGGLTHEERGHMERLFRQGRMTVLGLSRLDDPETEEKESLPRDLENMLAAHPPAPHRFASFPASTRERVVAWVTAAASPEDRARRVERAAQAAAQNRPLAVAT